MLADISQINAKYMLIQRV